MGCLRKKGHWLKPMQSGTPCLWKRLSKKALFERIEDEYDVAAAKEAYAEYAGNGRKSRPISELWKELGL